MKRFLRLSVTDAVNKNYTIEGVLVIFRHGDRGPLNHVQNLNSIFCTNNDDPNITALYNDYQSFTHTHWTNQAFNTLYQYLDHLHNHPPLPTSKHCEIGQLTFQGVMQHLKLGSVLRAVYYDNLFSNVSQLNNNVITYTTKYRRTFQSLNAFLYGFFRNEGFFKIPLRTVHSMYYCFEDCACPARDTYNKAVISENTKRLKSNMAILKLTEEISSMVYTLSDGSFTKDPYSLKDALLTYLCHNIQLPCTLSKCVFPEDILRIFSYIEWDTRQFAKNIYRQKYSILSAYGFVKNIISHLLKIVSNEKPKFILYSAHDRTIQFLLTALGINTNEAVFPPYASRIIFEVNRRIFITILWFLNSALRNAWIVCLQVYVQKQKANPLIKTFYFRLVFNGKDITQHIKFCTKKNRINFSEGKLSSKIYLCSFESLIRFLHDDYFSIFNSTNFKDACFMFKN